MVHKSEGTVFFPIIWHAHQPEGNFPWVIDEAYQKSYLPLLNIISEFPQVKSSIHFSGPLLNWLKRNKPEYLDKVAALYDKNQIEIIGGGFYEPILAIIPDRDKERQIQKMLDWWAEYNIVPQGFWLAERVWEPSLPSILKKMGTKFIFIDDYLFRIAGYNEEQTFYAYTTENQGNSVTVFPINEHIRYLIPWKDPNETIRYLMKGRDLDHETIIVMISDMEKMGIWPAGDRTTYDICYVTGYNGKPWMRNFFEAILKNRWIKPTLISDYLKDHYPKGLIYLPTSSYDKMAKWSLHTPLRKRLENLQQKIYDKKFEPQLAEDLRIFVSGSIWQNFLVKYPQANIMHKRMLYCRKKIENAEKKLQDLSSVEFKQIWNELLASQGNDVFWHGLFGGVYYRFLRHSTHNHIINAEFLLDKLLERENIVSNKIKIIDVLLDGRPDGVLENKNISCFISSSKGGSIFSLNLKEKGYNFLNVLTRHVESYHTPKMSAVNDRFNKWTCQDHFLLASTSVEFLQKDTYHDLGNFANQPYNISENTNDSLILRRSGNIEIEEDKIQTNIVKKYSLENIKVVIDYEISFSKAINSNSLNFSPEINILGASYPYKTRGLCYDDIFDLGDVYSNTSCDSITLEDLNEGVSITIDFSETANCDTFPLISLPKSEIGGEILYQGTSIFPRFKISGNMFKIRVEIVLGKQNSTFD
ncbi:MAG: alpha-amylase/4-alpha-glucanotransferase domain-containing protein [Candidatus Hodarchaeales archaeon]